MSRNTVPDDIDKVFDNYAGGLVYGLVVIATIGLRCCCGGHTNDTQMKGSHDSRTRTTCDRVHVRRAHCGAAVGNVGAVALRTDSHSHSGRGGWY